MQKKGQTSLKSFEKAAYKAGKEKFVFRLYISGTTPQSQRALTSIRKICEEYIHGQYKLEVIDIYQNPKLAKKDQIIAVPTLLKIEPSPFKRLIGDFSNEARVLLGLGIPARHA